MGRETVKAGEATAAGVAMRKGEDVAVAAPSFFGSFECHRPGEGVIWRDEWRNVVVNQGKQHILNRLFGSGAASTAGAFLQLHSATTASNHVWSNISASQVVSYGNNVPLITFASTYTDNFATATVSYSFTASTQTVSGAAVNFYTTNTMSTNAATAGILNYSEGQFNGGSRAVQSGDILSVSLTVSYA